MIFFNITENCCCKRDLSKLTDFVTGSEDVCCKRDLSKLTDFVTGSEDVCCDLIVK